MKRYAYKIVRGYINSDGAQVELEGRLSALGEQGWRIIEVHSEGNGSMHVWTLERESVGDEPGAGRL